MEVRRPKMGLSKLRYVLMTFVVLSSCFVHGYAQECLSKMYPPTGPTFKGNVTWYTVNLDLPPRERWSHVMKEKKNELLTMIQAIKDLAGGIFHGQILNLVDNKLPLIVDTLPYPFNEEIKGIAVVSGVPLGEVVLFNIFYEVFTVCTSVVAEDINGNIYHARNMDFGLFMGYYFLLFIADIFISLCYNSFIPVFGIFFQKRWDQKNQTWTLTEKLKPLVVNIDFRRSNRTVFQSTNFAGYVGILTGIRPREFTLTMNERFNIDGGYIGILEWIFGRRDGMWMSFLTRRVLENATSYEEAKKHLAMTKLLAPAYFILGGNHTGQGCVITRTRVNTLDIWEIDLKLGRWYVLETNYDHWDEPFFLDDRRTPAMKCMNKTTQANISFQTIYDVLSTKPVLNKLTTYTSLMEVSSGRLESYIRACPTPCTPW